MAVPSKVAMTEFAAAAPKAPTVTKAVDIQEEKSESSTALLKDKVAVVTEATAECEVVHVEPAPIIREAMTFESHSLAAGKEVHDAFVALERDSFSNFRASIIDDLQKSSDQNEAYISLVRAARILRSHRNTLDEKGKVILKKFNENKDEISRLKSKDAGVLEDMIASSKKSKEDRKSSYKKARKIRKLEAATEASRSTVEALEAGSGIGSNHDHSE